MRKINFGDVQYEDFSGRVHVVNCSVSVEVENFNFRDVQYKENSWSVHVGCSSLVVWQFVKQRTPDEICESILQPPMQALYRQDENGLEDGEMVITPQLHGFLIAMEMISIIMRISYLVGNLLAIPMEVSYLYFDRMVVEL